MRSTRAVRSIAGAHGGRMKLASECYLLAWATHPRGVRGRDVREVPMRDDLSSNALPGRPPGPPAAANQGGTHCAARDAVA